MTTPRALRPAVPGDIESLARLWHQGWHEAHAALVPVELTRQRTLQSFEDRLSALLDATTVHENGGRPTGFCTLQGDELFQLFVGRDDRGSGAAAALLSDGENRLAAAGMETGWLACVVGNTRAERFYLRSGWRQTGKMIYRAQTEAGEVPIEAWRLEKRLSPGC